MEARAAQRAHDRRPLLGSRFQDTCRQTREGGGLPDGSIIPAGVTHDLVLQFDLPARKAEREERLLSMNGGDVNETLADISREGGGKDARFLLAHGADANYQARAYMPIHERRPVVWHAAMNGHAAVVVVLLDAGAERRENALFWAATGGRTAVVALLLDLGVDVHSGNEQALANAVRYGHLDTATLLLQRGATATNNILALVPNGHQAIADLLRAHGAL